MKREFLTRIAAAMVLCAAAPAVPHALAGVDSVPDAITTPAPAAANVLSTAPTAQIIPVLRVIQAGKNPPAGYICLFELRVDGLGLLTGLQLSCADDTTKAISFSDAQSLPDGFVLKHVNETVALFIHINCDVMDLKIGSDFQAADGGSAQLFYQQNCRKNNQWTPMGMSLTRSAGSTWQVQDTSTGNLFNCLAIEKGGSGISSLNPSQDPSCAFPPRGPNDPIPADALTASVSD